MSVKILAVDFGDARTGLAVCDRTEFLASPAGVIHSTSMEEILAKVTDAAKEHGVGEIVVGHPINMNGTVGDRAVLCEEFAQKLGESVGVPVKLWDERATTVTAHQILNTVDVRGKKRKNVVDAVAATVILESYLAYRKNHQN